MKIDEVMRQNKPTEEALKDMDATDLHMLKQREELNERLEGELSTLNDKLASELSAKDRRRRKMLRKVKKLAHSLNITME